MLIEHPLYRVSVNTPFGIIITPTCPNVTIDELDVNELKDLVRQHALVIIRGFVNQFQNRSLLINFAGKWGEIMMWPFGEILDIKYDPQTNDHIFDNSYVPLHWDGMYKPAIPELQIFYCLSSPNENSQGGTTFTHTTKLLNTINEELVNQWEKINVTYSIKQVVHYGGKVTSPLITTHPDLGTRILRYNEPVRSDGTFLNQHQLQYHNIEPEKQAGFEKNLLELLYDKRFYYAHQWQQNDIVIADNFSLLHGRESFTRQSGRHIQRIHIHRDPVFSNPGLSFT